jgi:hypothetical protein
MLDVAWRVAPARVAPAAVAGWVPDADKRFSRLTAASPPPIKEELEEDDIGKNKSWEAPNIINIRWLVYL